MENTIKRVVQTRRVKDLNDGYYEKRRKRGTQENYPLLYQNNEIGTSYHNFQLLLFLIYM